MTSFRLKRHIGSAKAFVGAAVLPLLLAACSSDQQGDWGSVYTIFSQSFGGGTSSVKREDAAAIPFATIGIRIDGGREGMLILANSNRQQQLWTSASHIVLQTEGGRILRTAGLEYNRSDMRIIKGTGGRPPVDASAETVWEEDFADQHLYSVPVACHTTVRGSESVSNFGRAVPTVHVDEDCRSETIDWTFTNSYWISPQDGLTWRAIQYVSPKLGPIETETLRPPSE
jgi:hypothetical protein